MMKHDLRTNYSYIPPRPDIVPIPALAARLNHDEQKGWTTAYPAWNLQYYACLCSLKRDRPNVLIETGTNTGCSAALLAHTLVETGLPGHLHTFEIKEDFADQSDALFKDLGLSEYITIWRGNSMDNLPHVLANNPAVDFAFVDSSHSTGHCIAEAVALRQPVINGQGKLYFDNTWCGPVDEAIAKLKVEFGGEGWVDFPNCSSTPNGQAIWQPWQKPIMTTIDSKNGIF